MTISADGSYKYTPKANFNGKDSFTYTITDGTETITQKASITVDAVNDLAVSKDTAIKAVEDTVATGKLSAATDVDGDKLTYALADKAANGSVVVNADGSYSYTPNKDFFGTDSFTYTISDGKGGVITQKASVTVQGVNDAPVSLPKYQGFASLDYLNYKDSNISDLFEVIDDRTFVITTGSVGIAALDSNGIIDSSFGDNGYVSLSYFNTTDNVAKILKTQNNKIIIVGSSGSYGDSDLLLVQLNEDGTLDQSFGNYGVVKTDLAKGRDQTKDVVITEDGNIIISGTGTNFAGQTVNLMAIYNSDGSLNQNYNSTGVGTQIPGLQIDLDGLVAGSLFATQGNSFITYKDQYETGVMSKYDSNGKLLVSVDVLGGSNINLLAHAYKNAYQLNDGGIVVLSNLYDYQSPDGNRYIQVTKYNQDLELIQKSYIKPPSVEFKEHYDQYTVSPEGEIIFSALVEGQYGESDIILARYNQDGSLDKSFGTNAETPGIVMHNLSIRDEFIEIKLNKEGEILLLTNIVNNNKEKENVLVKFDRNGNLIEDFGPRTDAIEFPVTAGETIGRILHTDDFNFSDTEGDQLLAVIIDKAPIYGSLYVNQQKVEDGYTINIEAFNNKQVIYVVDESLGFSDEIVYRVQDDGGKENGGIDISEPASLQIGQNPYNNSPNIHEDDFIFLDSSWELSDVLNNNTINLSTEDDTYLQYYDSSAPSMTYTLDHNTLDRYFNKTFDTTNELRVKQTWGADGEHLQIELPTIDELLELYEQDKFSLISNNDSDFYWSATKGESGEHDTHMALNVSTGQIIELIDTEQAAVIFHII